MVGSEPAGAVRMRGRHSNRLASTASIVTSLVFATAVGAAIAQLASADRIRVYGGCGWDGAFYCAMVGDALVPEPFSRRVLVPFLVSHIEPDGLAGFWVVSVVSLVGATVLAALVSWRLLPAESTRAPLSQRVVPPMLAASAVLLARDGIHLVASYPVLTDPLALLLLLAFVALVVTRPDTATRLLLVPVCFLAPLTREQLAVVLAVSALTAGWMRLLPWLVAAAACAASVLGGAVAMTRPHTGAGTSIWSTFEIWVREDFESWSGALRLAAMLLIALGPFVLAYAVLWRSRTRPRELVWIAVVATIFVLVSVFGGGDTDRILTPAGLLLGLCLVIVASRTERGLLGASLVLAGYAVQQEPLHWVSGQPDAWLEFFGLRVTTLSAVVSDAIVPTLVALPLIGAGAWLLLTDPERISGASVRAAAVPRGS